MKFIRKIIKFLSIGIIVLCLCSCIKAAEDITYDTTIYVTETTETTTVSTSKFTTKHTTSIAEQTETTVTTKQATTATTKKVTTTQKPTTTQPTAKEETTTESGCANGNHSMGIGDIGKWFNSRDELQSYVSEVISGWRTKLANREITLEEYNQNAPTGYKAWSCANCGMWTGNFKYR